MIRDVPLHHDDVIKWKYFPRYWPFERGIPGEFPSQRPVARSFDVFFDLYPNKRLSKQSWGWWFETPPCSLWRHCNDGSICGPFPHMKRFVRDSGNSISCDALLSVSGFWPDSSIYGNDIVLTLRYIKWDYPSSISIHVPKSEFNTWSSQRWLVGIEFI